MSSREGTRAAARRQRERQERRVCILDAAEKVFLSKGLAAATMDEVAAEAELSKGTLYLYFDSKDELYLAIVLRSMGVLEDRFRQVVQASERSGLETLHELAAAYVDFARSHKEHFRLGMAWLSSGAAVDPETSNFGEYRELIGRLFAVNMTTIERGKADGSIRPDIDAQSLALQMWGSTVGLLLLTVNQEEVALRVGQNIDFGALFPSFIELVLGSIKASETEESER